MTVLRAAFHVHSEWSYDARIPLPEVGALLGRHGYDAVFMCEHDRGFDAARLSAYVEACAQASDMGPLLIPGIEYGGPRDTVHVPVWGAVPFLGEQVPTLRLLQEVSERDGVACLAHPVRRDAWRTFEPEWLSLATGIEIWTRKWDGWAPNPRAVRIAAEHGLVGCVALDLHEARQTFPLSMELVVDGEPSVAGCVDALRRGRCRALIHGIPVQKLTHGPAAQAAQRVERVRRPLFRRARVVRERMLARG